MPGTFDIVRCRDCGARQTHPAPADLSPWYAPEVYAPHQEGGPPLRAPGAWSQDGRILPDLPRGALVLELGCGRGDFLRLALARGWRVEGVEPAPAAAAIARRTGALVHERPIESAALPAGAYDAVFGWMVVEHLERPVETMKTVARLLRPGGMFLISVPDAGSWEFSAFGPRWYALHCPVHLTHFDRFSLARALRTAGLRPVFWRWQRNGLNLVGSLGILLEDAGAPAAGRLLRQYPDKTNRWVNAALYPLACILSALRWGGRMDVISRRDGR